MSFYLKTKISKQTSTWMFGYEREGPMLIQKEEVETKKDKLTCTQNITEM